MHLIALPEPIRMSGQNVRNLMRPQWCIRRTDGEGLMVATGMLAFAFCFACLATSLFPDLGVQSPLLSYARVLETSVSHSQVDGLPSVSPAFACWLPPRTPPTWPSSDRGSNVGVRAVTIPGSGAQAGHFADHLMLLHPTVLNGMYSSLP